MHCTHTHTPLALHTLQSATFTVLITTHSQDTNAPVSPFRQLQLPLLLQLQQQLQQLEQLPRLVPEPEPVHAPQMPARRVELPELPRPAELQPLPWPWLLPSEPCQPCCKTLNISLGLEGKGGEEGWGGVLGRDKGASPLQQRLSPALLQSLHLSFHAYIGSFSMQCHGFHAH